MSEEKCICNGEDKCLYHKLPPETVESIKDVMSPQPKEELEELKSKSDVINDSLWYVNPKDIQEAIESAEKRGRDEILIYHVPVQKAISEETAFLAGQESERERIAKEAKKVLETTPHGFFETTDHVFKFIVSLSTIEPKLEYINNGSTELWDTEFKRDEPKS